jgi:hypothetical protein
VLVLGTISIELGSLSSNLRPVFHVPAYPVWLLLSRVNGGPRDQYCHPEPSGQPTMFTSFIHPPASVTRRDSVHLQSKQAERSRQNVDITLPCLRQLWQNDSIQPSFALREVVLNSLLAGAPLFTARYLSEKPSSGPTASTFRLLEKHALGMRRHAAGTS